VIVAEFAEHRLDLTVRKEILWESETATDSEVRALEMKMIRELGSNKPAMGYNLSHVRGLARRPLALREIHWHSLPRVASRAEVLALQPGW
jgi:hypothetical protein